MLGSSWDSGAWMREVWNRDSVYVRRILSGITDEPRAGVIISRRVKKEAMSKYWSDLMLTEVGASVQSAVVIPFAIVTIEVQIGRMTSSDNDDFVILGSIAWRIASDEVVASCQGGEFLVVMAKEYFKTIGRESAFRHDESASLVYIV